VLFAGVDRAWSALCLLEIVLERPARLVLRLVDLLSIVQPAQGIIPKVAHDPDLLARCPWVVYVLRG
jgi:hypothetical protein